MNESQEEVQAFILKQIPLLEKEYGVDLQPKKFSAEKRRIYKTIGGTPHLDNEYTVFGQVVEGLEVIDKIAAVAKDRRDRPKNDVPMMVSVEMISKKRLEKDYAYIMPGAEEQVEESK
jgi:peptidyl-prolyl cis-trans isomerase B (cyclophilin B)